MKSLSRLTGKRYMLLIRPVPSFSNHRKLLFMSHSIAEQHTHSMFVLPQMFVHIFLLYLVVWMLLWKCSPFFLNSNTNKQFTLKYWVNWLQLRCPYSLVVEYIGSFCDGSFPWCTLHVHASCKHTLTLTHNLSLITLKNRHTLTKLIVLMYQLHEHSHLPTTKTSRLVNVQAIRCTWCIVIMIV